MASRAEFNVVHSLLHRDSTAIAERGEQYIVGVARRFARQKSAVFQGDPRRKHLAQLWQGLIAVGRDIVEDGRSAPHGFHGNNLHRPHRELAGCLRRSGERRPAGRFDHPCGERVCESALHYLFGERILGSHLRSLVDHEDVEAQRPSRHEFCKRQHHR
jgi:hypothetical protein